jgi:hypothetical protein
MSAILFRVAIGAEGVTPGDVRMTSTDDLTVITQPGYLNSFDGGTQITPTDIISAVYGPNQIKQLFTPTIVNGVITLTAFGGGGSINGAENLPGDEGIFAGVSGDNLQFKSLSAGANITLTPTGDTITIAATGSGGGTITGIADAGIGQGHLAAGTSGADVLVKTIVQGSGVIVTENGTTVTIAAEPVSGGLTTLANLPGGEGIYASTVGTVAQLKSIVAGAGIAISATGNNVIITNTGGGGGGGFLYDNAQWVAQNGNDANDGRSIDTPKLTVQAAITALGGSGIIHIEDDGNYGGAWNIASGIDITIDAPAAFLNTSGITFGGGGSQFKANAYSFGTNFNTIISSPGVSAYINAQKIRGNFNSSTQLFITGQELTGDYTLTGGTNILSFDTLSGDIIDTGIATASAGVWIYGRNQTGSISSANTNVAGYLLYQASGTTSGIKQGYFDGVYYGINEIIGNPGMTIANQIYNVTQTLTSNYTVQESDSNGALGIYNVSGTINITLPDVTTLPGLYTGWRFYAWQGYSGGGARFVTQGNDSILSQNGPFTREGLVTVILTSNSQDPLVGRLWTLAGNLAGGASSLAMGTIFVSQLTGSNTTGNGSQGSPYATIQYAVTAAGSPSNPTTIFVIDGQTYNEAVTISSPNIYLVGPEAALSQTGSGTALTFTTNATQHFVNMGAIFGSSGATALANTGTASIVSTGEVIDGPISTVNGQVFIRAVQLTGAYASTGSGFIRYTSTFRSGTDGTNTVGTSATGTLTNWSIGSTATIGATGSAGSIVLNPSTAATGSLDIAPTSNTANVITTLTNQATSTATVHSLPATGTATATLMAANIAEVQESSQVVVKRTQLSSASLASGGQQVVLTSFSGSSAYRFIDIKLTVTGGLAGGDRNIAITDGTTIWTVIPSASVLLPTNARWGSTPVPFSASQICDTATVAGANVYATYSGGTTDYTSGAIGIEVIVYKSI